MRRVSVLAALFTPIMASAAPLEGTSGTDPNGETVATINMSATLDSSSAMRILGRSGDPFTNTTGLTGDVAFEGVNISDGSTNTTPPSSAVVTGTNGGSPPLATVALVTQLNIETTLSGISNGSIEITGSPPGGTNATANWLCSPTGVAATDWSAGGVIDPNFPIGGATVVCASLTTATATTAADIALILSQGRTTTASAVFTITLIPGA